jgi:predicted RNA-binding Zn-ribbon protein involved in translation (DUF1610 family)
MSLTAPELTGAEHVDGADATGDALLVTCSACGTRQHASGRSSGYTCRTCGSVWRVLRCRGCRRASVVLDAATACPRCGHEHRARGREAGPRTPTWLSEPAPLSVWLGGVKYLGGHAHRDQPVTAAGLLLDRRGIHLRAFAELFSISWDRVDGIDIEGPLDISERLTTTRLLELGATTWAMRVAYLTVRTADGDAIFEIDGLGPPELHARLSRVLQGLQRSDHPPAPIALERSPSAERAPVAPRDPDPPPGPRHDLLDLDPTSNAPLEVLVIDALWKLARLRETGLLDDVEVATLRAHLLARVSGGDPGVPAASGLGPDPGPLLHV